MKTSKKIIALFLTVLMVATTATAIIPVSADEAEQPFTVDGQGYTDFATAYVKAMDGGVLYLNQDLTLNDNMHNIKYKDKSLWDYASNTDVVIDGRGEYAISVGNYAGYSMFITKGNSLTIQNVTDLSFASSTWIMGPAEVNLININNVTVSSGRFFVVANNGAIADATVNVSNVGAITCNGNLVDVDSSAGNITGAKCAFKNVGTITSAAAAVINSRSNAPTAVSFEGCKIISTGKANVFANDDTKGGSLSVEIDNNSTVIYNYDGKSALTSGTVNLTNNGADVIDFANSAVFNVFGASVRTDDKSGIRFTTQVNKDIYDALSADTSTTVKYGLKVIRVPYIDGTENLSVDFVNTAVDNITCWQQDCVAWETEGERYNTVLWNIPENYYNDYFCATAYVSLTDSNVGSTVYYYASYSAENNARSYYYVAKEALSDYPTDSSQYSALSAVINAAERYKEELDTISGVAMPTMLPGFASAQSFKSGTNTYEAVYTDIDETEFDSYLSNATANNFEAIQTNTDIVGNTFVTLTGNNCVMSVAYIKSTREIRTTWEHEATTSVKLLKKPASVDNVYDTMITQLGQGDYDGDSVNGMSYVIRLSDGRFIVIDGGHHSDGNAKALYNYMDEQNGGTADDVVIAAWIFTHSHQDHVAVFYKFAEKYSRKVTVEYFVYNFPTPELFTSDVYDAEQIKNVETYRRTYFSSVPVMNVHTGQTLYIGNATVQILFAPEMLYSTTPLSYYNDSSLVFTVSLDCAGTTTKFFVFGDAGEKTSVWMKKAYYLDGAGESIFKSDIMQISHHGVAQSPNNAWKIYSVIDPMCVLWPAGGTMLSGTDLSTWPPNSIVWDETKKTYLAENKITVLNIDKASGELLASDGTFVASSTDTRHGTSEYENN